MTHILTNQANKMKEVLFNKHKRKKKKDGKIKGRKSRGAEQK